MSTPHWMSVKTKQDQIWCFQTTWSSLRTMFLLPKGRRHENFNKRIQQGICLIKVYSMKSNHSTSNNKWRKQWLQDFNSSLSLKVCKHGHAHILTQITVACTAARHCCQENLVLGYDDHEQSMGTLDRELNISNPIMWNKRASTHPLKDKCWQSTIKQSLFWIYNRF